MNIGFGIAHLALALRNHIAGLSISYVQSVLISLRQMTNMDNQIERYTHCKHANCLL